MTMLFLTFDNEFLGVFGGRNNIFFSTKFVVKCAAKILKIGLTNIDFMSKLILNRDLALQGR